MANDAVYEVLEHGIGPYLPGDWIGWSLADLRHALVVVRPDGSYYTLPCPFFTAVLADVYNGSLVAHAIHDRVRQESERVLAFCA